MGRVDHRPDGESVSAVLYAAKSTQDVHGSIPDQLARTRAAAESEGRIVVAEYTDEGRSAFSGNRGPGLEQARTQAAPIGAELWVLHSDRLARGEGRKPGDAKHLVEYVVWANRSGVRLRSVEDDMTFSSLLYAVVMGDRNAEDSRRKSQAVKAGMRRRAERGEHHGGPRRYGYLVERGKLVIVPEEARVVRRIWAARAAGQSQRQITRDLNADGIPSPRGGLWKQATVRGILLNPIYTGRIQHRGEVVATNAHDRIVDEETWLAVQAMVCPTPKGGRPSLEPFLLRGLRRCGRCGHAMITRTYRNRRGSLYAVYRCLGRIEGGPDFCSQPPVPRDQIDTAVAEFFLAVGVDYEATRAQLREQADQRLAMLGELETAAEVKQIELAAEHERLWADRRGGRLDDDDWQRFKSEHAEETAALVVTLERLASQRHAIEAEAERVRASDEVAELLTEVRAAVAGSITAAATVEATAAAIRRVFAGFTLMPSETGSDLVPSIRPDPLPTGTMDADGVVTLTLDRVPLDRGITDTNPFVT